MKHTIYPIFIEDEEHVISSLAELKAFKEHSPTQFKRIVISGDAERMCRSFAIDDTETVEICDFNEESTSLRGQLAGLPYKISSLIEFLQHATINISGYHRQKTVLTCDKPNFIIEHSGSIRFCTILGCDTLIIKKGVDILFDGVIFDKVTIIVEDGGSVSFRGIEISGSLNYACKVLKGGVIKEYKDVVFLDTLKNFYVEHADRECIGAVVDFEDASKLVEFIESSIVPNITLYGDFVPANLTLEFKQPIAFYNNTDQCYKFHVNRVMIEQNFLLIGNFEPLGEYKIAGFSDIKISLSSFNGKLLITDATNIFLADTLLYEMHGEILLEDTQIELTDCSIDNWQNPIKMSGSQVFLGNTIVNNMDKELFLVEPATFSTKEFIKISQPFKPAIVFYNKTKIYNSEKLLSSELIDLLTIDDVLIERSQNLFSLTQAHIEVTRIHTSHSHNVLCLHKCSGVLKSSEFENGQCQFEILDDSDVQLEDTKFSQMKDFAFSMENSRVVSKRLEITDSANGIELKKGYGEFYHQDLVFRNIQYRHMIIGHGVKNINLNSFVE